MRLRDSPNRDGSLETMRGATHEISMLCRCERQCKTDRRSAAVTAGASPCRQPSAGRTALTHTLSKSRQRTMHTAHDQQCPEFNTVPTPLAKPVQKCALRQPLIGKLQTAGAERRKNTEWIWEHATSERGERLYSNEAVSQKKTNAVQGLRKFACGPGHHSGAERASSAGRGPTGSRKIKLPERTEKGQ